MVDRKAEEEPIAALSATHGFVASRGARHVAQQAGDPSDTPYVTDYPPARRLDLVEELHGRTVADPYRWLEDPAAPETAAWSEAQDALCRSYLDALPGRDGLRGRLLELLGAGLVTSPTARGSRMFFLRRTAEQEHAVLYVTDAAGERALVDPMALSPDGLVTLDGWQPSKEGDLLAYQVSSGGDEEAVLYVLDVATGSLVEGPIDRVRYSPVAWVPGGGAYYYVRRLAGEDRFHRRVWRHAVGSSPESDELVWGEGLDKTNYYGASVSLDGRWLVVSASAGTAPRTDVWLADLHGAGSLEPVVVGVDAQTSAHVARDGRLYVFTDLDAPRGRLCVASPLDPGSWTDLVPESGAVLDAYAIAGDALLVLTSAHAVSSLAVHDRATGELRYAVPLPGTGSVSGLSTRPEGGPDAWFGYTDYVTPNHVHHLDVETGTVSLWAAPPGAVSLPDVSSSQVFVPSADGTPVPLFVLAPPGPVEPRPAILYGYGGFGVAMTPAYSAGVNAWVEAGGVYAVACLRGGSEEGEDWHRAGMRERKQNVFEDFEACASWLVSSGHATAVGISGGSNGGLLVGAALTRQPSLYRAVVCSAPLLDMVRYELFGLGETWNDEYGTASSPEELEWLLGYSPYHRVEPGRAYPAVLFTVFDSDTRVDPLHARKMCAALQHASVSGRPVLLRRETDVGHGARSISRTVDLSVDTMAFLAAELGLSPPWGTPVGSLPPTTGEA